MSSLLGLREPVVLRLIAPLALIVVAATVVCGVLGAVLARQADDAQDAARRQALRGAIEELQASSGDVDPSRIRILERASGLKGLRFEDEPPEGRREVQSLVDAKGRIVGWFSWEPEQPATELMSRLLPLGAVIAVGLFGFAVLAMWQLRRRGSLLATSTRELKRLAFEDPVTGLANLHQLRLAIDRALAARGADESLAIALIDLGGFDEMKETVGDAGGDEILIEIATRLRRDVPPGALIARMRGDRFGVVLPATEPDAAIATMSAIRESVSRAIWIDQVIQIGANVGLAMAPRDGTSRELLMRRCELALQAARQRGRGLVMSFSNDMESDSDDRRFIRRELSRALAARSFELHYQPIVRPDGAGIVGVEALLRWNHPNRGYIPPGVFVRVAEEAGLMDQLGEFVLRQALADAARWPDLYMAINLSPIQVRDRRFVALVADLLKESQVEPSRVVLEITEGMLIDDPLIAKSRLEELRRLGVRLALDDFGAGYSSLAYLRQLPFDKLKVDRGFVAALDQSANAGVIIQAIVNLGRALGMSVLIEGVETEEQRVLLRLAGCTEMQGYLFARPAPRAEIDRLMSARAIEAPAATRAG